MTIAIKIVSIGTRAVDGPRAEFGPAGGTIGRRSDMTLVIPDKTRRVSRVHAVISHQNGQYRIRDQGSFLPVYVNGHGVGFQRDMTIHPGDHIQIGDFGLQVANADADAVPSPDTPVSAVSMAPVAPRRAAPATAEAVGESSSAAEAPFLSTLKMDRSPVAPADAPTPVPSAAPRSRRAIEDGPATFALLEQRLTAQTRNVPWPDISMYRDIPEEDRANPIPFDGAATQDLHGEKRGGAKAPDEPVADERHVPFRWGDGAVEPEDLARSSSDDAPPSDGGYVIPIRKRRRRA